MTPRAGGWLCAVALAAACKETPPPVGFRSAVDAQAVAPATDAASADVPEDVARFEVRQGVVFREAVASVTVEGATLNAPEGERFSASLALDLDGDGVASDALVARVGASGEATGVSLYRRQGEGFAPAALDAARPARHRCGAATLRQTSPRSVVLQWRCAAEGDAGVAASSESEVVALALGASLRVWARASVGAALPDTVLALDADAVDRDADGVDELVLSLAAGRPGHRPGARARLVYFQRGDGLARDTAEPAASLAAVREGARRSIGRRRAATLAALESLDDLARLRRALCAEVGAATLRVGESVAGVACGDAPFAGVADLVARALSALGEHPAALATAEGVPGWGTPAARTLTELGRAAAVDRRAALRPGPFAGADLSTMAPLHLGVLRLESAQNPVAAWLQGPVTGRVDLATLGFAPGEAGSVDAIAPRSPDGQWRFVGAAETCSGVVAVTCPVAEPTCAAEGLRAGQTALPTGARVHGTSELAGPSTLQRCLRDPASVQALGPGAMTPLGWGARGLIVARAGRLWRVAGAGEASPVWSADALGVPWPAGQSVNEAGSALAVATTQGLWLRERTGWRRLALAELEGRTAQLRAITLSNDARTLAAMLGTQVMVVQRR